MKTAIIGYSGSGKSELFKAIAGDNFKNLKKATVKVPEPRLQPLIKLFNPKKITYTEIEIDDFQGDINSKSLNEIKNYDCLIVVLDGFSGFNDPENQKKSIEDEFIISDLSIVENRLSKSKKLQRDEKELLLKVKELLDKEVLLREEPEIANNKILKGYRFLSAIPVLYVWNVNEEKIDKFNIENVKKNEKNIVLSAKLEREMSEIDNEEDLKIFMEEFNIKESALNYVIKSTYELLNLITFLTAGEKEVRAWPLKKGSNAKEAAGVIHSDLERGFIRAEVLSWSDFLKYGDFKNAKKHGALRLEGKDYIVKDGDIITFYFNV